MVLKLIKKEEDIIDMKIILIWCRFKHHVMRVYHNELDHYPFEHPMAPFKVMANDMHNYLFNHFENHNNRKRLLKQMFPHTMSSAVQMYRLLDLAGLPFGQTFMVPDNFIKSFISSPFYLRLASHRQGMVVTDELNNGIEVSVPVYPLMSDPKKLQKLATGIAELEPLLNPGQPGVIEVGDLLPRQSILLIKHHLEPLLQ